MKTLHDVDIFLNDNYLVLMVLYQNQQKINNCIFTAMTQQEMAENLNYSLMKINSIMKKLKKAGYVNSYKNSRGRYQLTNKAYTLITDIKLLKGENKNGRTKSC